LIAQQDGDFQRGRDLVATKKIGGPRPGESQGVLNEFPALSTNDRPSRPGLARKIGAFGPLRGRGAGDLWADPGSGIIGGVAQEAAQRHRPSGEAPVLLGGVGGDGIVRFMAVQRTGGVIFWHYARRSERRARA
jgi:hypothetical protein